jgi:tripartite-type tricarboxylate transporter receptor subunit TctC
MEPEVVARLNAAINKIVDDPQTKARLAELGFDAFSGTPESFAQFVQDQYELWGKWIREANLQPQ